jgi:hypothetical protein
LSGNCSIDNEAKSEHFVSITPSDSIFTAAEGERELYLGAVKHANGFEWPSTAELMTLAGSINGKWCKSKMLVDSGASANFISNEFMLKHRLTARELKQPFKVRLVDQSVIACASIIDKAHVQIEGIMNYNGVHEFIVLQGLKNYDVILGMTFLKRSRSVVDFEADQIKWKETERRQKIDKANWRMKDNEIEISATTTSKSGMHVDKSTHQQPSNSQREATAENTVTSITHEQEISTNMNGTNPAPSQVTPINTANKTTNEHANIEPTTTSTHIDHHNEPTMAHMNNITQDRCPVNTNDAPEPVHKHWLGSEENRATLKAIIDGYERKMSKMKNKLPPEREGFDHAIPLKDANAKPIKLPPIRQKPALARAMKEALDKLIAEGKIRKSSSPYGAPAFMVPQGTKQRMVVNYAKLNDETVTNAISLPTAEELISRLSRAKVFTKIDCMQGFHQVRVKKEDIMKTGFTTPFGHYEWLVMPFGDKNAPATFVQLLTQSVLVDIVHDFIIVFVDDILVFSDSIEDHLEHVKAVLDRLAAHQLFVNPQKCEWMVDEVDFLGYRLKAGENAVEVMIQEHKAAAVREWGAPTTISQLRAFLGNANFSRAFIPNFSTIAKPLTDLTSGKHAGKSSKIVWNEQAQHAFDELKRALTSAQALAVSDEDKPFTLYTDASDFGIGATLCQFNEKAQQMQTIGYFSAKLSGSQLNWTTYDKEMYALVRALEHWQMYFVQSQYLINVFTDNVALLYLLKKSSTLVEKQQDKICSRQARWINTLMRFNINPSHIEGKNNVQADALSRRPDYEIDGHELQQMRKQQANAAAEKLGLDADLNAVAANETSPISHTLSDMIRTGYADDELCRKLLSDTKRYHVTLHDGLIKNDNGQIIVPNCARTKAMILNECHDAITSGHLGTFKTASRVKENFDWVGLVNDVSDYCKSCEECQANKARNMKEAGLLNPISPPFAKGLEISIDFVGELPTTARHKDLAMVITDRHTKRVWYHATKKTVTAKQAARIIFERVVTHQGLPRVIISDRDVRFNAKLWKELWKECGTKLSMTVAFRAEANGGTETQNRVMQDMLRSFVNERRTDWDVKLPALELAYNSSINQTTGFSPFELDIGMKPRLPIDIVSNNESKRSKSLDTFMNDWEETWASAHNHISSAQIRMKNYADRKRRKEEYAVGDYAWIRKDRGTLQNSVSPIEKLAARVEDPYEVIELHGDSNVTLRLNENDGRHSKFHVSQLRPYQPRDMSRFPDIDDASPQVDEGEQQEDIPNASQVKTSNSINESTKPSRPTRSKRTIDHGPFIAH